MEVHGGPLGNWTRIERSRNLQFSLDERDHGALRTVIEVDFSPGTRLASVRWTTAGLPDVW